MSQTQWSFTISIIAALIACASAIAGFGRWLVTYRQIRVQNLLQISQYLHQAEYRDARHAVRTTPKDQLNLEMARKVCSSFDFAALFVRHGLVDESIFLEYWGPLLVFLKMHLAHVLEEPAFGNVTARQYYRHFDWLMEKVQPPQKLS
jgi:hypothetical protein